MSLKKNLRKKWRRQAERKSVGYIRVKDLTTLDDYKVIASHGLIVDASTAGFLIEADRSDLCQRLKDKLSLQEITGHHVVLYLPQMILDLEGFVTRTSHVGQGIFHIAVEFSQDTPEYWRKCLYDFLPQPGEMES